MRGWIDLHCHWVADIDDGVRNANDGVALLAGLKSAGFDLVVATPHMRPGMFDNDPDAISRAFAAMQPHLARPGLPDVALASEHYFDDETFARLLRGEGLPYPSMLQAAPEKRSVLIELPPQAFPPRLEHRLYDLRRKGLRPVIAHPERYQPVWKDDRCLDPFLDAGASLLLDVCALLGKYGRAAQKAAERLLDDEAYEAACSDAHRPADAALTSEGIGRLFDRVGTAEAERLLGAGPRAILGLDATPSP